MVNQLGLKNKLHIIKKFSMPKQKSKRLGTWSISMGLRLFLFSVVLVLTMLLGAIIIMLITGTFAAGISQSKNLIENELLHISQGIEEQYALLSMQAVEFSKTLSESIENKLGKQDKNISNLHNYPELLEELISSEYEHALFSLQRSKCSGVFIILNATINPKLENAQNSKAGLYIKNMEPNIISSSSPTITILRGFPSIGRENSLPLHAQWSMEFDISDAPYYTYPLETANNQNNGPPLSRLYYWSPSLTLPGTSEEVMLCSVPLIDSVGNAFGVCGFEISAMLFKLFQMPNNRTYNRIFCTLSPLSGDIIDTSKSMFAGGYSAKISSKGSNSLKIIKSKSSFYSYRCNNENAFLGLHMPIQIYPEDSAFSEEKWISAIMVPEKDIVDSVTQLNLLLFSLLILLVLFGVIISLVLSRKYLKPISQGFDIIKSKELSKAPRTKISEINDLIDFLSLHNETLHQKAARENLSLSTLDEFMENSKALSPAERAVFNLYVRGFTAKESAEILCLSINTIKTHNRRIYMKLNVASRKELLVYVSMLKEIGQEFK
jgi:DNA-binding CsgD family transcriptional regulator